MGAFFEVPLDVGDVGGPDCEAAAARRNGTEALYVGPVLKLAALGDEDFASLDPGDSVYQDFELAALFELGTGERRVAAEYRNPPTGSHEGRQAFTALSGEGIHAEAITIEVTP